MRSLTIGIACAALFLFGAFAACGGDVLCMEAEAAGVVVPHVRIAEAGKGAVEEAWGIVKGASGNSYIEVPQGKNPASPLPGEPKADCVASLVGEARYAFEVKSDGSHYMWCRVWWLDSCGNSFAVSIDGARPFTFGQDGTYRRWHWMKAPPRLTQLKLSKGRHTLRISNREDGIRLDQILFTKDRRYVPVGIEDVTYVPLPVQATGDGESKPPAETSK